MAEVRKFFDGASKEHVIEYQAFLGGSILDTPSSLADFFRAHHDGVETSTSDGLAPALRKLLGTRVSIPNPDQLIFFLHGIYRKGGSVDAALTPEEHRDFGWQHSLILQIRHPDPAMLESVYPEYIELLREHLKKAGISMQSGNQ